ncbi:MAG TPA: DinB family protein [Chloroflexia bacterium]|nr:DinB family protein [Chloroflexia bacterium]
MTTRDTTLMQFYSGWEEFQGYLRTAVAPLGPEQLALRVGPEQRAIGLLAAHIIAARASWFGRIMGEGDAAFAAMRAWDDVDPPMQTGAELAAGLDTSWQVIAAALGRWTVADFDARFHTGRRERTRQWIIWHVMEHDLYHGGELFLTCGLHGLPVPDL